MRRQLQIVKGAFKSAGPFAPIRGAAAAIRARKMVIVVDDEDRENEGDLTMAAEKVTTDATFLQKRPPRFTRTKQTATSA